MEAIPMDFDVTTLHGRRADQRWNRMVVGDIFERLTWSHPDKIAIKGWAGAHGDQRFESLTYQQADDVANQIANALKAEDLHQGDRVLLYCENSVEAVMMMFGIAKAGLVVVPVNPMLAPDVLSWVIDHVDVSFVVVDAALWPQAAETFETAGRSANVTIPIGGDVVPGSRSLYDWIVDQPTTEVDVTLHADDVWSLLFTSGTTAMPKASMSTHNYSYMSGFAYAMSLTRGVRYETDLVLCTFLPIIYHCGHNSTVFPALLAGGTAVIGRKPDPQGLAEAITAEKVTAVWAGSPAWVQALVDKALASPNTIDLTSLKVAMFSWGAMNPNLSNQLKEVCGPEVNMLEVFGQTESMSCFRFWPEQFPEKHEKSFTGTNYVGTPNPMLAADIVDTDGKSLRGQVGVPGEAVYRSPIITAGYYNDPEATEEAFRGGWFHSGDSCAYDEDGLQIMVDRFKDIVKSGGENVSSIRVETVLAAHPGVERVAVIGIPDEKWGEVVTAVVIRQEDATVTETELMAFARERLAGYEAPKKVVFAPDLPQTVGGKILKYKLRDQLS